MSGYASLSICFIVLVKHQIFSLKCCEQGHRLNCWLALVKMKGCTILVNGNFCLTAKLVSSYVISPQDDLLSCRKWEDTRFWSSKTGGERWRILQSLILHWEHILHHLIVFRSWRSELLIYFSKNKQTKKWNSPSGQEGLVRLLGGEGGCLPVTPSDSLSLPKIFCIGTLLAMTFRGPWSKSSAHS